jgi:hypothetical protein
MSILSCVLFLSTLVYQYDFTFDAMPYAEKVSASIDFLQPCGTNLGFDSIYALRLETLPSATYDGFGRPLPLIASRTLSLSDFVPAGPTFSLDWNGPRLSGLWAINFNALGLSVQVSDYSLSFFYPLEYAYNESSILGEWKFAGTRNVPEAGSTLLYLALGIFTLMWRKP